jgi:hypothetical protein
MSLQIELARRGRLDDMRNEYLRNFNQMKIFKDVKVKKWYEIGEKKNPNISIMGGFTGIEVNLAVCPENFFPGKRSRN